jgi:hypothetical protein
MPPRPEDISPIRAPGDTLLVVCDAGSESHSILDDIAFFHADDVVHMTVVHGTVACNSRATGMD